MTITQKGTFFKQAKVVFLMLIVALMATITRVSHGEITVERIREFICDTSGIGNQQDIAFVENGDMGETIFIRPADQECHFYLFHRGASGDETQLSGDPGGYLIVQAGVLNSDGVRTICASDSEHTAVKGGESNERRVGSVSIQCWIGGAGSFKPGVTVVGKDPEYAAWVARVEAHPTKAATYRVVWIRDFSFQFMNMSDAGRPATDGTYETTFTLKGQKLVVGATTKLADTTMYGAETETRALTQEEMELLFQ
jgi:hypothetical protein